MERGKWREKTFGGGVRMLRDGKVLVCERWGGESGEVK
jgi:hypothetical protein